MDLSNRRILPLLVFLIALKCTSGIILTEVDQINLESTGKLLPPQKQSMRIQEHLRAVRHLYPVVANIHHDAAWVPGEVVVLQDEINSNIGVIKTINESEYGPLLPIVIPVPSDQNEVILSFERPYHGERLSSALQKQFNVTVKPNFNNIAARNQISYVYSAPTYLTYTFKKSWKSDENIYSHFWQFTVATSDTITVTLEKEYGDDLF